MPDDEKQQDAPVRWVPAPQGIAEVYSNFLFVNWSMTDVRIRFAQLVPTSELPAATPPTVMVERVAQERAAITMSWIQAKVLRDLLADSISRYEAKNGELKLPNWPL